LFNELFVIFFPTFLPLAVNQHLIAACQCKNKSPAHFLLQIKAIFQSQSLKCEAKKDQMKKMKIFKKSIFQLFFMQRIKKNKGAVMKCIKMLFLFRSAPEVKKKIHSKLFRKFWEEPGYTRANLHYCTWTHPKGYFM